MKLMQVEMCEDCERAARTPGAYAAVFIEGAIITCDHVAEDKHDAEREPSVDQELYEAEANVVTSDARNPGSGG